MFFFSFSFYCAYAQHTARLRFWQKKVHVIAKKRNLPFSFDNNFLNSSVVQSFWKQAAVGKCIDSFSGMEQRFHMVENFTLFQNYIFLEALIEPSVTKTKFHLLIVL